MSIFLKILVVVVLVLVVDIGRYFFIPDVDALVKTNPIPTAFMEYRQEQWSADGRDIVLNHTWVPMSKISPNIAKAVLIGEDDGFYSHEGFDVKGMENAIERSIKKGTLAGGSTISQQLSKNLYLSPSKNPVRKLKEAILTYRIEKTLSKKRILEIYLNVAEWGDGIFGIEAAAQYYYHKRAKNLTAFEASRLASVLPNPIRFNPKGNQKYVKNRSKVILKTMQRRGVVDRAYVAVMRSNTPASQTPAVNELPLQEAEIPPIELEADDSSAMQGTQEDSVQNEEITPLESR